MIGDSNLALMRNFPPHWKIAGASLQHMCPLLSTIHLGNQHTLIHVIMALGINDRDKELDMVKRLLVAIGNKFHGAIPGITLCVLGLSCASYSSLSIRSFVDSFNALFQTSFLSFHYIPPLPQTMVQMSSLHMNEIHFGEPMAQRLVGILIQHINQHSRLN